MIRFFLAAVFAAASSGAAGQTSTAVSPALIDVQRTAPHLVAFTGSQANFQNLVVGLTQGAPVTLSTVFQDGTAEIASFTPTVPLSPTDVVAVLERARATLTGLNVLQPTAAQLGAALAGGTLDSTVSRAQLPGVLPQAAAAPGVRAQRFFVGIPGTPQTGAPAAGGVAGGIPNSPAFPSQTPGFPSSGGSFPSQTPGMIVNPLPGPIAPGGTAGAPARAR